MPSVCSQRLRSPVPSPWASRACGSSSSSGRPAPRPPRAGAGDHVQQRPLSGTPEPRQVLPRPRHQRARSHLRAAVRPGGGGAFRVLRQYSAGPASRPPLQACPSTSAGIPVREHQPRPARAVPPAARQVRPVHALARRRHPRSHDHEQAAASAPRRDSAAVDRNSPAFQARQHRVPEPAAAVRPRWQGGPAAEAPPGG